MVLEDGLTSSFNHDLRMTLESSIEDVDEGRHRVQLVRRVAQEPLVRGSNPSGARVQWIESC